MIQRGILAKNFHFKVCLRRFSIVAVVLYLRYLLLGQHGEAF